jgi:hypothetical protein
VDNLSLAPAGFAQLSARHIDLLRASHERNGGQALTGFQQELILDDLLFVEG